MAVSGRERVEAALRLQGADRPPVSAWGHTYEAEWAVDPLVETTVGLARRFQFDFIKLQVRMTCFAETFGARWRYSGSPAAEPVLELAGGTTAGDWRRIAGGSSDPGPLREQVSAIRSVVSQLGPGVPVLQTVFSPGMVAWFLAGRDLNVLRRLIHDQPGLMAEGLARIAKALSAFTAESLDAGAAGVFYAINPLAGTEVVEPAEYERLYLPSDRIATAAAAGGWFNMLHLCGPHIDTGLVERLREHMHCVNWSTHDEGNPGLAELRDRFRIAVAGGLERHSPIRAEPAEMRTAADAALAETGGRGHLLTLGCSVSPWPQARPENLEAMTAAVAALATA